jgi:hypothetical protein
MRLPKDLARRAFATGAFGLAAIVAAVSLLYRFSGDALSGVDRRPAVAGSWTNPEFLVPIAFFALSIAALKIFQISNLKSRIAGIALLAVLLLDVASYGHFFHWRLAEFDAGSRLADPPAVQLIKSRERELSSFRVMSQMMLPYDYAYRWPEDPNYEAIDQPNVSMLRGLQSVSGYDILRPVRVGEITGSAGSAIRGFIQDFDSFGLKDRGLDLMNVKYLIAGHGGPSRDGNWLVYDGVEFARSRFNVEFKPGVRLTTEPGGVDATEIAVVSTMANSTHLPDGAPALKLRLHTSDGPVIDRDLALGRDTSEWAHDRPDVKSAVKHKRARIVESAPAGDFQSHFYLGRLGFDRAKIEKIEWSYPREDASLYLIRASLRDAVTGRSTPLAPFHFPPERWRKLARFDQVEVYENLRPMPRAWFVDRILVLPGDKVLGSIKTGALPGGQAFDPAKMALLDEGGLDEQAPATAGSSDSQVKIVNYEPNRIDLSTKNSRPGFLVLSEVFFRGWEARVDGQPVKLHRVNYTLRGVAVPAGDHRVEVLYLPESLRNGAIAASLGILLLLAAAAVGRFGRN